MIEAILVIISGVYTVFSVADVEQVSQALSLGLCEIEAELVGAV